MDGAQTTGPVKGIGISTMGGSVNMEMLPGTLDTCEALAADYVELSLLSETIVAGGRILPAKLAQLKRLIAGRPFGYTVHGPIGINFMDVANLDLHKQVCAAFIEVSGEIGAEVLVIHTGGVPAMDAGRYDRLYAIQREALHEMGEMARPYDLRICVENVFGYTEGEHTALPSRLATELAALDHPHVRGTLDFGHARIQASVKGHDYAAECRAMAPRVGHLHVHDNFGRPDVVFTYTDDEKAAYGLGDLHMPVGWGAMDWESVLPTLDIAPGTVLMLEINRRYWSDLADSVATARRLMALANGVHVAAAVE